MAMLLTIVSIFFKPGYMIDLSTITSFYPEKLHGFPRFILREYLQHKILEAIFQSVYATKLAFIGGTCLRIVHGNTRFSEDIDFDNLDCTAEEWEALAEMLAGKLRKSGYEVEMRVVQKNAWHCYIRFPQLLFNQGLSGYAEEKILIQIDAEPLRYTFEPQNYLLNRFDVFTDIFCAPLPLLMAQKCHAVLNRKRNKGRDFFDLAFLMSRNQQPDWNYLHQKISIENTNQLKDALLQHCTKLDMGEMADDAAPFLFNAGDKAKIILFPKLVAQYWE